MQAAMHRYVLGQGWDTAPDPQMDSVQTLLLVFAPARLSDPLEEALQSLAARFPNAVILGCSSAGEIYQDQLDDNTLAVSVMRFEQTHLRLAHAEIQSPEQSESIGQKLGAILRADDLVAVFTLTDGLLVNGSAYVHALGEVLPEVVITGGMAADADRFEQTWVMVDGERCAGCVVACGFYGERVRVQHASRGGWDLLGVDRLVTHSEGNVLFTLDERPALALYKEYLGDLAEGLPGTGLRFPLALHNGESSEEMTVRTILAIDEDAQSITFAGDIPTGAKVRLMSANYERLITGAAMAGESLEGMDIQGDAVCVAISCVGRRLVLGARAEEELESVREALPQTVRLLGYYSYGEISPLASGRCDLHNQTMTLTLFSEV